MDKSDFSFNYYKSNQRCWSCTRSVCGESAQVRILGTRSQWQNSSEEPLRRKGSWTNCLPQILNTSVPQHVTNWRRQSLKGHFEGFLIQYDCCSIRRGISSERSREETAVGQWQGKAWNRLLHSPQKEPTQPRSWSGFRVLELKYKLCRPSQSDGALCAISHG